jgi:hypothetical protein
MPAMDAETEEWPIPAKHKAEFESMKFENMAWPLRVYHDNIFVVPGNVNEHQEKYTLLKLTLSRLNMHLRNFIKMDLLCENFNFTVHCK